MMKIKVCHKFIVLTGQLMPSCDCRGVEIDERLKAGVSNVGGGGGRVYVGDRVCRELHCVYNDSFIYTCWPK